MTGVCVCMQHVLVGVVKECHRQTIAVGINNRQLHSQLGQSCILRFCSHQSHVPLPLSLPPFNIQQSRTVQSWV